MPKSSVKEEPAIKTEKSDGEDTESKRETDPEQELALNLKPYEEEKQYLLKLALEQRDNNIRSIQHLYEAEVARINAEFEEKKNALKRLIVSGDKMSDSDLDMDQDTGVKTRKSRSIHYIKDKTFEIFIRTQVRLSKALVQYDLSLIEQAQKSLENGKAPSPPQISDPKKKKDLSKIHGRTHLHLECHPEPSLSPSPPVSASTSASASSSASSSTSASASNSSHEHSDDDPSHSAKEEDEHSEDEAHSTLASQGRFADSPPSHSSDDDANGHGKSGHSHSSNSSGKKRKGPADANSQNGEEEGTMRSSRTGRIIRKPRR